MYQHGLSVDGFGVKKNFWIRKYGRFAEAIIYWIYFKWFNNILWDNLFKKINEQLTDDAPRHKLQKNVYYWKVFEQKYPDMEL